VGLAVAGGVLVAQGGRLKELRAGKVGVEVSMAVAEKDIASRKAKVELPRVLRLGDAATPRETVPVGRISAPAEPVAAAEGATS
jgi:hypothetical protein